MCIIVLDRQAHGAQGEIRLRVRAGMGEKRMKQMLDRFRLFFRKKSLFFKTFFLLLLLTLATVAAVIYFLNSVVVREQRNHIEIMRKRQLEQAEELVGLQVDELQRVMVQFLQDSDVVSVMVNPQNQDPEVRRRILQTLTAYSQEYQSLSEAFFYLPYTGEIYHSDGTFLSLDSFPESDMIQSYQESRTNLAGLSEVAQQTFTYQGSVFLVSEFCVPNFVGALFFQINGEHLYQLVQGSGTEEIYVRDAEGNWLFREPGQEVLTAWEEGEMLSCQVEALDWEFLCLRQNGYETADPAYVFRLVLPFLAAYLALSLAVTVKITHSVYRPIARLLFIASRQKRKGGEEPVRNEMEYLEMAYTDTLEQNQEQRELLAGISNDVLDQLFRSILAGQAGDLAYVSRSLRGLDRLDLLQRQYMVLAVSFHHTGGESSLLENSLYQRSLKNVAEGWQTDVYRVWSLFLDETLLALLLFFPENWTNSQIYLQVGGLEKRLYQAMEQVDYQMTVGKGKICQEITQLQESCQEAIEDIRNQEFQKECRMESDSDLQERWMQYYAVRGEQVAELAEQKNAREAIAEGTALVEEICQMPQKHFFAYFQQLLQPVRERLSNYGVPEETVQKAEQGEGESPESLESPESCRQYMLEVYHRLLKLLQAGNQNKKYRYVKMAQEYIENHYQEGSLSLNEVSEAIGISSTYLSEVFSDVAKAGFSAYLNKCRVEQAKAFLRETNRPTGEIGIQCGFNSAQNFTRVFKKYTGLTPGQFREESRREEVANEGQ